MTSSPFALLRARIFDGSGFHDNAGLLVSDGRIAGIVPEADIPTGYQPIPMEGGTLAPGLVDLQVNGGGGVMFNDAPSVEPLRIIAQAHLSLGTTSILPTLITDTPEITRAAIDAVEAAIAQGVPGIVGLHLEGPHLSIARKGAHDPALIRPMTEQDMALLTEAARRLPVLFVTVAPENVSMEQMRRLTDAGVILSLGHSDCDFATACAAADHGAQCVTHLFNAMSQLGHREPGMVGAALARPELSFGLIADFIHVHPEAIRVALAAKKGAERVYLVSDAMAPAGTDLEAFTLNGRTIQRQGGRLTLADGTLAGADLDLPTAIRNVAGLGISEAAALAMASSVPARVIGLSERIGSLRSGAPADLVLLDAAGRCARVWKQGEERVATA
ncbi:N-acetylglucosamine-6-phosphate deacetylase [Aliiruegeria sabulilitoris]|uniref:N-acetylglucosamine-6-phosphate deacetylase n=1 Tax=Aliiruegeria sabulilitoris TaxID=1510458 RepID=UPI00082C0669|nr:N-acetylglucosamine-6-phosphate deacetylase [Aliiruegeria sabulilitoris]NDR55196.1 N-acetylglucosamine-6-phosphate deacetylase [Pseudoruegeria sp. M32A2M]